MIRVLPESLVNRIAAGEVIVRPASVVKELVENSIDAGSTEITVEVANACRDILIRDNGKGMDRADAKLALVRHATSKIEDFDDLYQLSTRGFRGEALASIASVSRMQILTRRPNDIAGTLVSSEGSGDPRIEPAGAPEGTEVRIRELFFNTPARLKFLKSPASELQQILMTITRQALIRPDLGFKVVKEGMTMIDVPAAQPWADRVTELLGTGVRENLLDIDDERHGIKIRGFVLRPAITRKDRRHQFFFVNNRPVSSRSMSFVLQEAYKGVIMVQRYPICVLDLELAPGEVDVNVHPTKEEVRFRSESMVNGVIHRAVHARLQAANLMPTVSFGEGEPTQFASPTIDTTRVPLQAQQDWTNSPVAAHVQHGSFGAPANPVDFSVFTAGLQTAFVPTAIALQKQAAEVFAADPELAAAQSQSASISLEELPQLPGSDETNCSVRPIANSLRHLQEHVDRAEAPLIRGGVYPEPLGQIGRCYIVAQFGGDLLMVDQHAAHERLLYLKFSTSPRELPSQPLFIPVSVDVPASAVAYMERLGPLFTQLGLKIEPFGGQTYLVQSIPADLPNLDAAAVVADLLDDFESLGKVEQIDILRDRIITRMACRAAIKAGQNLHVEEMRALIRDIANARLGFTCPHGRPTMVLLTRDQLDRQFKRKL
jgi:DNA mismatch repair protein MutL